MSKPHILLWCTLWDVLSLLSLRDFTLYKVYFVAKQLTEDDYTALSLPPITIFKHRVVHAYAARKYILGKLQRCPQFSVRYISH